MVRRISQRLRTAAGATASTLTRARQQLQHMQPLGMRILDQTRARLLGGNIHQIAVRRSVSRDAP